MMALSLSLILISKTIVACAILVVDAVNVYNAFVAGARLPRNLDYPLICTGLNCRLAETSSKFLLSFAALATRILRVL